MEHQACNICKSTDQTTITKNLVVCNDCGLAFLSPRMSADEYAIYYRNKYDRDHRKEANRRDLAVFHHRIKTFKNAEYVLDYGSGAGEYLQSFTGRKYAIEPSLEMHAILREKGIKTDVPPIGFDFIVLRHVVEHFLNPVEELTEVREMMSEDARIYIAVPNNLSRRRGKDWLRIAHTYYFNPYSLLNIFQMVGLSPDRMEWDKNEVWAIVRKCKPVDPVLFGSLAADQAETFNHVLKWEQSILYRLKHKIFNLK